MKRVKNCLQAMLMLAVGVTTANHTQAVESNEDLHKPVIQYLLNREKDKLIKPGVSEKYTTDHLKEIEKGVCFGVSMLYIKHLMNDNGHRFLNNLSRMMTGGIASCPEDFKKELDRVLLLQNKQDIPDQMLDNIFKEKLNYQRTNRLPCKDAVSFKNLLNFHDFEGTIACEVGITTDKGWHSVVVSPIKISDLYVFFDVNKGFTTKKSSEIFELLRQKYCAKNGMQDIELSCFTPNASPANLKKLNEYLITKLSGGVYGILKNHFEKLHYYMFRGGGDCPGISEHTWRDMVADCISEMKQSEDCESCSLDIHSFIREIRDEDVKDSNYHVSDDGYSDLGFFVKYLARNIIIPLSKKSTDGKICRLLMFSILDVMDVEYDRFGNAETKKTSDDIKFIKLQFKNTFKASEVIDFVDHYLDIASSLRDPVEVNWSSIVRFTFKYCEEPILVYLFYFLRTIEKTPEYQKDECVEKISKLNLVQKIDKIISTNCLLMHSNKMSDTEQSKYNKHFKMFIDKLTEMKSALQSIISARPHDERALSASNQPCCACSLQ